MNHALFGVPAAVYAIGLFAGLIVASSCVMIYKYYAEKQRLDALRRAMSLTEESTPQVRITLVTRWYRHWHDLHAQGSTSSAYAQVDKSHGNRALMIWLFVGGLFGVMTTPLLGLVAGSIAVYILSILMQRQGMKGQAAADEQLPGFLSTLTANLQAGATPERAMLASIEKMPSPLFDELVVVREHLNASATFGDAMLALEERTASRELQFLCVAVRVATKNGATLEPTIRSIQESLVARRKIAIEVESAVASVRPTIWLSNLVLPGLFLATLVIDPNARTYWFVDPTSWLALGLIVPVYGFGMFISRRMVANVTRI